MGLLVLAFVVVPVVEIWLLVLIGGQIGFWPTVGVSLATALVGGYLAKREGRRVLGRWRDAMTSGRVPDEGLLGGALVLAGGVLLVLPGVLTDVLGLALLFPPTRRLVGDRVRARLERRLSTASEVRSPPSSAGGFSWSFQVVDLGAAARSRYAEGERLDEVLGDARRGEVIEAEAELVADDEPRRLLPAAADDAPAADVAVVEAAASGACGAESDTEKPS